MADSFRANGKRAQTIRMINAAAVRRFPATSRAGRAAPATCGKRVPSADEGVVKRGHACAQSRGTYSSTGPPAGSTSESAGCGRWPPPSDRVTKRSYEKNESVVHATPDLRLHRTWAPISWTARGANKDDGFGQFVGPAD